MRAARVSQGRRRRGSRRGGRRGSSALSPGREDLVGFDHHVERGRRTRVDTGPRDANGAHAGGDARHGPAEAIEGVQITEVEWLVLPPLDRSDEAQALRGRIAPVRANEIDLDAVVGRPEATDTRGIPEPWVGQDLVDGLSDQRLDRFTAVRGPVGER